MAFVRNRRPSRRAVVGGGLATLAAAPLGGPALAEGALDAGALGLSAGAGDQSAALADALQKATGAGRPLLLPPGDYAVSAVELPSGARLVGVGPASRLLPSGRGPVLTCRGAADVGVADISVDGLDVAGGDGLFACEAVERLDIDACHLLGSAGDGLSLAACSGRVRDSRVSGAAGSGIFSRDGRALSIRGNVVEACGDNGILVWQSSPRHDGSEVAGNRISRIRADSGGTGQNGNAVNVFRAGGVRVVDNDIADCAFSAVRNNAGADVMIARNLCRDLGEVAIYAEFGFEGAVISDNLVHGAAHGISATNWGDGGRLATISGNLIRAIVIGGVPEDRGVGISAEADASISGNVVDGAAHAGLVLGWGPYLRNVAATGNVVRKARYGIIASVADGAGPAMITGNLVVESGEAAIAGFAWQRLVETDLAGRAEDYPHLTIGGNRTG